MLGQQQAQLLQPPPAPTLLQPSNTQVGAIGTTTEYFVTFQYDDNSSFTSPSTVYDIVESSSHTASWTPPSGFTYIRARFTTLIRDGGTRGAWSDTITYGTAPSFDGDAEAITWSFNVGEATGSTVAPVPNEFSGNAEPITWTFNVGDRQQEQQLPLVLMPMPSRLLGPSMLEKPLVLPQLQQYNSSSMTIDDDWNCHLCQDASYQWNRRKQWHCLQKSTGLWAYWNLVRTPH